MYVGRYLCVYALVLCDSGGETPQRVSYKQNLPVRPEYMENFIEKSGSAVDS